MNPAKVRRISVHFSGKATVDVYVDPNKTASEIEKIALEALDQGHGRTNEISVNQILFEDTQPDSLIFTIPHSTLENANTPFTSNVALIFEQVQYENDVATLKLGNTVYHTKASNIRELKTNDLVFGFNEEPLFFISYDREEEKLILSNSEGDISKHNPVFLTDSRKPDSSTYSHFPYSGLQCWRNDKGQYHREDGPALIFSDGSQQWFHNGKPHRTDGPAYVGADGKQSWFLHGTQFTEEEWKEKIDPPTEIEFNGNKIWRNEKGQLHRENGPAIIKTNGYQEWYQNGNLHRINGPAVIRQDGTEYWYFENMLHRTVLPNGSQYFYQNGKRHCDTGPAVIQSSGNKRWYLDGIEYTEEEWKEQIDPPTEIEFNGTKIWRNEKGQYHRDNGPAIIRRGGTRFWYRNNQLHREDGPAIISNSGQYWYQNDKSHRTDGPAIIYSNGIEKWHLDGIEYSELKWRDRVDPPTEIDNLGNKAWKNEAGNFHSTIGPAYVHHDGSFTYFINGKSLTKEQWEKEVKSI